MLFSPIFKIQIFFKISLPLCVGFYHTAAQVSLDCALASVLTSLASPPSRPPGAQIGSRCSGSSPALLSPQVCAGGPGAAAAPHLPCSHPGCVPGLPVQQLLT